MYYYSNFREHLAVVAADVGWPEPDDYNVAERDQIDALTRDLDREVDRYPLIHAWRTSNGSQLQFWCRSCKTHHFHGRHLGKSRVEAIMRWDAEINWVPRSDAALPLWLWKAHLQRFADCRFNDNVPGGRGICTCPAGSGDGHRAPHCWNREGIWYEHGYILHEVEPNDGRALQKPKRKPRAK
ncbi:hypothetical protein [Mycobacterium palustre]|uniref:hypothetical protein n=1 Tax=Mycobacterium palustre TaxID=153971 RepID=UPI00114EEA66|nr:hypothetical protein [Mycobacterium palustre]MCV7100732.1 hypothetical protein [Mycobacterium palustre]